MYLLLLGTTAFSLVKTFLLFVMILLVHDFCNFLNLGL
jgi:hypothetical protein